MRKGLLNDYFCAYVALATDINTGNKVVTVDADTVEVEVLDGSVDIGFVRNDVFDTGL